MRRGPWVELETSNPNEFVLVHPGWTQDTDSLFLAIRETGWYATNAAVIDAVEHIELSFGWIGVDENGDLAQCHFDGRPTSVDLDDEDTDRLDEVNTVTFARICNAGFGNPARTARRA